MAGKHFKTEQVIHMLREAEIKLAGGETTGEICLEVSEQNYNRWRKVSGGIQVS